MQKIGKIIRQYLSKKYLDWAEALPKFQGGFIKKLQTIREHQRKTSNIVFKRRKKPDNVILIMKKIRIVIAFQLEQFQLIQKIVRKLFPNNEKIRKFVKELKDEESSIHAMRWQNIGLIVKDEGLYFGEKQLVAILPKYVKMIHVSYHRIMPSIACLSFTFHLEDEFSQQLNYKQSLEYLLPITFNDIFPFRKRGSSYSMGGENDGGAQKIIREDIFNLVTNLFDWLKKRALINQQFNIATSIIEMFELQRNPLDKKQPQEWINENNGWLNDYSISMSEYDSYRNEYSSYCESTYHSKKWHSYILTFFKDNSKEEDHFLDLKMDSLAVMAAIYSILEDIQKLLEKNRKLGFHSLAEFDTKILNKNSNIIALKRLGALLNRLNHEFEHNNIWIKHSLEGISDLKSVHSENEHDLTKVIISNVIYKIDTLIKSCDIVDAGLTSYLTVQNIYAMYRLQRWMFILAIVVTIATIVSVLSGWENLKKLWTEFEPWYKNYIKFFS